MKVLALSEILRLQRKVWIYGLLVELYSTTGTVRPLVQNPAAQPWAVSSTILAATITSRR
jgi:hypothetical protein